jgi:hypothetical protein
MIPADVAERIKINQYHAASYAKRARESRIYWEWLKRTNWTIAAAKELRGWHDDAAGAALYARDARALLAEWIGE